MLTDTLNQMGVLCPSTFVTRHSIDSFLSGMQVLFKVFLPFVNLTCLMVESSQEWEYVEDQCPLLTFDWLSEKPRQTGLLKASHSSLCHTVPYTNKQNEQYISATLLLPKPRRKTYDFNVLKIISWIEKDHRLLETHIKS